MKFYKITHRLWRKMYDRGWTRVEMDDTLRSRIAHAMGDWRRWYDWGHPVMWLVGRNDSGNSGVPRGRDMWWIPVQYVEGVAASLVADFEQLYGCYVTRNYADVRATSPDIDWRIYDLQDDGNTVKIGLWPNQPEHQGRIQSLPSWHNLGRKCEMRLFLRWYLWEHKTKAQWFGLRRWVYYKALHWAVNAHSPFACGVVPEKGSGGYSHWHCDQRKLHRGPHRYRNYIWPGPGSRVEYAPIDQRALVTAAHPTHADTESE